MYWCAYKTATLTSIQHTVGGGGGMAHSPSQILTDQSTLSQPGGQIITPTGFLDLPTALLLDCGDGMNLNGLQSAISSSYANEGTNVKRWTHSFLKFIYSEKATKFCEISSVDLTITT